MLYCLYDTDELICGHSGGSTSAYINAVGRSVTGCIPIGLHVSDYGICIALVNALGFWNEGIKIAVCAFCTAKGDMDIYAQLFLTALVHLSIPPSLN